VERELSLADRPDREPMPRTKPRRLSSLRHLTLTPRAGFLQRPDAPPIADQTEMDISL